jgi:hypothetical protein
MGIRIAHAINGGVRMAKKTAQKRAGGRKKATKRELIDIGTDKRFVRRGTKGRFKESDDVGKSLTADRRVKAKTKVKSGQGDKGDR